VYTIEKACEHAGLFLFLIGATFVGVQKKIFLTRSIPVDKLMNDAILAYGQNGEAIRPEQGYPARLVLPGWEGNTSVKWIHPITGWQIKPDGKVLFSPRNEK
jgi:DMSO/TMAO reductase YedYZ molybdopterin-dependent catalytic subunit